VEARIVFGEEDAIRAALAASPVSTTINTAFVEVRSVDRKRTEVLGKIIQPKAV
jgi:hypothetical protein